VLDRMPDNFFAETEQVAFMTQNVPPGIDFSNDPLLQGRNFSYLDTQLKRLGGPNFTHLPINAPKCPLHNFQQDGHMAMRNPVGRTNYQPNSRGEGPRESPVPKVIATLHLKSRGRRFACVLKASQIITARRGSFTSAKRLPSSGTSRWRLTFELSKVENPVIRERMVSHLMNIDETLATTVAQKLGFQAMPKPADAAMPTRQDLEPSPALSIIERGPKRFEGRKLGILITDGVDAKLLKGLTAAIIKEKAVFELIAPKVGGVTASDGSWVEAHHMIDGGPSVLFDAVALLTSAAAIDDLVKEATARDFVADAFQHCKYIGYDQSAFTLLEKAGIAGDLDEGVLALPGEDGLAAFVSELGKLRVWGREPSVKLGKASPPIK
jgi:catalase